MEKKILLTFFISLLSRNSVFSSEDLSSTINNIKVQLSDIYSSIDSKFGDSIIGWPRNVTFNGSLKIYVSNLGNSFKNIDLSNLTNLDLLAPSLTNEIRDFNYTTADNIIQQIIRALGYTSLSNPISDWQLIGAPVPDCGSPMSSVIDNNGMWIITINSNTYQCSQNSLPTIIRNGSSIAFSNSSYGNLTFQYTGADFDRSQLDDSLQTNGISFNLPANIYDAINGLAKIASRSNIDLSGDEKFKYSAAQRLSEALNAAVLANSGDEMDPSSLANLDLLAPSLTSQIRDSNYTTADNIIQQIIKVLGYTLLNAPIADWQLIGAPVPDCGSPMSAVIDNNGIWVITINSNAYQCSHSDLPNIIKNGSSIAFSNSNYGNLTFQYTGIDFDRSQLGSSLQTNGISFNLPTNIYDAINGLAKIASRFNTDVSGDEKFKYSAAQRLSEVFKDL